MRRLKQKLAFLKDYELEATDIVQATALRQRARLLYLRARDYALRGLYLRHPGFTERLRQEPALAVRVLNKTDVPLAYWAAVSWGAAIGIIKDNTDLIAEVPAVESLAEGGASQRLVRVCRALFGHLPGGAAIATAFACAAFTSFTGASGVTILALGGLLFPILRSAQYSERNALGLLTGAGSINRSSKSPGRSCRCYGCYSPACWRSRTCCG